MRDVQARGKGSAGLPERAREAEEARSPLRERWGWVEPLVWTERMLATLEAGVEGGRWFSLMDKVYSERTLGVAWERVKRNGGSAGVDRQSVEGFSARAEQRLGEVRELLRSGRYRPEPVRRVWIPKAGGSGERPLGIPTVRDRVVQTALKLVLEPIFEAEFAEGSYGFRPGRGRKKALGRVQKLLDGGATWVVDVAIKSYFDSIPQAELLLEVERRVADGSVLKLVGSYLEQGVLEGLESWQPEAGTPQGAVISPLPANIYLDPLDKLMASRGYQMVRYADDMVVLCPSESEARQALEELGEWVTAKGLELHPEKTRLVDAKERGGFDFLGYHFERGKRWPSKRSEAKLKAAIRAKTRRTSGESLSVIIEGVNRVARGWFGYFKHSVRGAFPRLDGWIRMRVRSILRRRSGRRGRERGRDRQRWPNVYFTEQGLFTFVTARALAVQS
jgi:RNA-directed DNA polymerase